MTEILADIIVNSRSMAMAAKNSVHPRWEDAVLVEDAIVGLESKFAGELHDAGITVAGDFTESCRGPEAGGDRLDIGVVGRIERFHAELEVQAAHRCGSYGGRQYPGD